MTPDRAVRVLMVCWGNICRSPTAEGILRHLAQQQGIDLVVDSAGTSGAHHGSPPDDRAIAEARRRGIDISGQRARKIGSADFEDFDLILTADRMVDDRVRRLAPPGSPARIMRMTAALPDFESHPDVPDPYFGTADDYRQVFDLLERALRGLLGRLGGERVAGR